MNNQDKIKKILYEPTDRERVISILKEIDDILFSVENIPPKKRRIVFCKSPVHFYMTVLMYKLYFNEHNKLPPEDWKDKDPYEHFFGERYLKLKNEYENDIFKQPYHFDLLNELFVEYHDILNEISSHSTFFYYYKPYNVTSTELTSDLDNDVFKTLVEEIEGIIVYEEIIFVSEKAKYYGDLTYDFSGCENGPTFQYTDGLELYIFNNLGNYPRWLLCLKPEELKPEHFLKLKDCSIDIRTHFVNKIGLEKLVEFGKLIDTYKNYPEKVTPELSKKYDGEPDVGRSLQWIHDSEYELYDMGPVFDLPREAMYLKMKNGTTGQYHLEGVSNDCRNIIEALSWREEIPLNYVLLKDMLFIK